MSTDPETHLPPLDGSNRVGNESDQPSESDDDVEAVSDAAHKDNELVNITSYLNIGLTQGSYPWRK